MKITPELCKYAEDIEGRYPDPLDLAAYMAGPQEEERSLLPAISMPSPTSMAAGVLATTIGMGMLTPSAAYAEEVKYPGGNGQGGYGNSSVELAAFPEIAGEDTVTESRHMPPLQQLAEYSSDRVSDKKEHNVTELPEIVLMSSHKEVSDHGKGGDKQEASIPEISSNDQKQQTDRQQDSGDQSKSGGKRKQETQDKASEDSSSSEDGPAPEIPQHKPEQGQEKKDTSKSKETTEHQERRQPDIPEVNSGDSNKSHEQDQSSDSNNSRSKDNDDNNKDRQPDIPEIQQEKSGPSHEQDKQQQSSDSNDNGRSNDKDNDNDDNNKDRQPGNVVESPQEQPSYTPPVVEEKKKDKPFWDNWDDKIVEVNPFKKNKDNGGWQNNEDSQVTVPEYQEPNGNQENGNGHDNNGQPHNNPQEQAPSNENGQQPVESPWEQPEQKQNKEDKPFWGEIEDKFEGWNPFKGKDKHKDEFPLDAGQNGGNGNNGHSNGNGHESFEDVPAPDGVMPVEVAPKKPGFKDVVTHKFKDVVGETLSVEDLFKLGTATVEVPAVAAPAHHGHSHEGLDTPDSGKQKLVDGLAVKHDMQHRYGKKNSGNLDPSETQVIDPGEFEGHRLVPDAALSFRELNDAFKARFGKSIHMTDSYRPYEVQVSLKAKKPRLAAQPGTSNHGWALAVDLASGINEFGSEEHEWMRANAVRFGWYHPDWAQADGSKPEAWHWEFAGKETEFVADPDEQTAPAAPVVTHASGSTLPFSLPTFKTVAETVVQPVKGEIVEEDVIVNLYPTMASVAVTPAVTEPPVVTGELSADIPDEAIAAFMSEPEAPDGGQQLPEPPQESPELVEEPEPAPEAPAPDQTPPPAPEQPPAPEGIPDDAPEHNNNHIRELYALHYFDTKAHVDYTPEQAAGIVGNFMIEAPGLDPKIKQGKGGPGRGIAQWTVDGRWQNLLAYAERNGGLDPYDLDTQLGFVDYEMQHDAPWKKATPAILDAATHEAAAIAFEELYEKPGIPHRDRRTSSARMIYELYMKTLEG